MAIEQKKSVYNAVVSLYRDNNRPFTDGDQVELSSDERRAIIHVISQGLQNGSIMMKDSAKEKYDTPKKIHNYATGLVSDRLRKDKRLNGNSKYEIQNPGSRAGANDEVLKGLREYRKKSCFTPEQKADADKAIQRRLDEINMEKRKLNESKINMDLITPYLTNTSS